MVGYQQPVTQGYTDVAPPFSQTCSEVGEERNYIQDSSKPWATGGSAEQPLQVPGDRALNQPKPHPSGKIA